MNFQSYIKNYETEFLADLETLIRIPSVRDISSKTLNVPFGTTIRQCFDAFQKIAEKCGFKTTDFDGYVLHAATSEEIPYIGVLGHLDVVDANQSGWETLPFELVEKDGILYGRGVNDDKGPLLASLYALRILNDLGLIKKPVRIIAGGAEETTWECMEYYFQRNKQPEWAFSPDGNFPIVNGEKGILQLALNFQEDFEEGVSIQCSKRLDYVCDGVSIVIKEEKLSLVQSYAKQCSHIEQDGEEITLIYHGKSALSRNPHKGENALFKFANDFKTFSFRSHSLNKMIAFMCDYLTDDFYGEKLGINYKDKDMGMLTVCPMSMTYHQHTCELCIDVRYVKGIEKEAILKIFSNLCEKYSFEYTTLKEKRLLYVEENSPLITSLQKAYQNVMHEKADVLTKGGASYARVLDHGVVFGATFGDYDTKVHMANENMPKKDLLKAMEIYCEALYLLSNF